MANTKITAANIDSTSTGFTLADLTVNGDINLGDNDKAIFGAGSDLQIYHDSTSGDSRIVEGGTGHLALWGNNIKLLNAAGTETMLDANPNAAVTLYYDNSAKLATTSTGIDVTGTVVADGLTVEPTTATGLTYAADGTNSFINFEANSVAASVQLYAGQSSGGYFSIGAKDSGGTLAERIRVTSTGVGIGVSSPTVALEVGDGTATANWLRLNGTTSDLYIGQNTGFSHFGQTNATKILSISNHPMVYGTANAYPLIFGTNDTERMRIDSSGNCGIGTQSPDAKLKVEGDGTWIRHSGYGQLLDMGNWTSGLVRIESTGAPMYIRAAGSNYMAFDTNSVERMRIDSSGNVLLGTTNSLAFITSEDGGASAAFFGLSAGSSVGGVGISSRRDYALQLNRMGSDGAIQAFRRGGTIVGSISVTGSATAYNTSSDARLKDVTGEARGLEVINELNPVAYNWKESGQADEGLIAQEVMEIVPNAVSGSEEEMYQMDYSKLVVHLVKAIQEQQAIIDDLKSRIEALEG